MALEDYDRLLIKIANDIIDMDVRETMLVVSKNKMYPKDCLTNGSLENLIRKIIKYEREIIRLGGKIPV